MRVPCALSLAVALAIGATVAAGAQTVNPPSIAGTSEMTLDDHKALARRSLQMWASGNHDTPEEVFAADYINHQAPDAKGGEKDVDLGGWKEIVRENHTAFSDFGVIILLQVAEGDLVATRWQFKATQTGTYLGHPPSGMTATWTGVQTDRFKDGKIVESWVDWDKYRLFEALGFLK